MYQWYKNSAICYVFLPDVRNPQRCSSRWRNEAIFTTPEAPRRVSKPFYLEQLRRSVWFKRAWTLQELLAPKFLDFHNAEFHSIGSNLDLAELLAEASRIPVEVLCDKDLESTEVVHRMRWAVHRRASRGEDMAYSFLGIFGVNMPLLYGEGETRAFQRLQKEIRLFPRRIHLLLDSPRHHPKQWRGHASPGHHLLR